MNLCICSSRRDTDHHASCIKWKLPVGRHYTPHFPLILTEKSRRRLAVINELVGYNYFYENDGSWKCAVFIMCATLLTKTVLLLITFHWHTQILHWVVCYYTHCLFLVFPPKEVKKTMRYSKNNEKSVCKYFVPYSCQQMVFIFITHSAVLRPSIPLIFTRKSIILIGKNNIKRTMGETGGTSDVVQKTTFSPFYYSIRRDIWVYKKSAFLKTLDA